MRRRQFMRLVRIYQHYRQIYPGFSGFKQLTYRCVDAIREGVLKGLRNKVSLHERIRATGWSQESPTITQNLPLRPAPTTQSRVQRIALLRAYLEKGLILNPTIIFDHDGGGGANAYTHELVKIINADGGIVLRVYCFDAVWFVQWISEGMGCFSAHLPLRNCSKSSLCREVRPTTTFFGLVDLGLELTAKEVAL